jgi:peptidoglycan hydrolase-like protein with peptidoglycan-binding domain
MKRKPFVSVLFLAVAALALNGAPSWAQSEGSKEKSVGGTRSERSGSETETPLPKGSPSAGSTDPSKAGKGPGSGSAQSGKDTSVGSGDPSKAGQGARSASQGMGQHDIREAQEALKSQGHDPGPIDGVMGSQTRQALREFQSKNGLKQTGNLDAETKQKLNIEGSSSGSPSGKGSGAKGKGDSSSRQKEPSSSPMGK